MSPVPLWLLVERGDRNVCKNRECCINEWRRYEDITRTISHLLIEVLE